MPKTEKKSSKTSSSDKKKSKDKPSSSSSKKPPRSPSPAPPPASAEPTPAGSSPAVPVEPKAPSGAPAQPYGFPPAFPSSLAQPFRPASQAGSPFGPYYGQMNAFNGLPDPFGVPQPPAAAPTHPPALPSVYFGAYAYAHDMTGAYHSRYGSLAAVDAQLIAKRERILQQMAKVQAAAEAVQAARRGIERETMADAEAVIHRLRSAEAVKMSVLHHDLETLRGDATAIDAFHAAFSRHCPSTAWSPAETRFDASEQAMAFISAYPELSAEAERLSSKPLKVEVDVSPADFERETAVRLESLRKFDAMSELLATKDKMIWKLLKEREAAAADLDTVAKASASELQEWKRLAEQLSARIDSYSMVCAYCACKLGHDSVNTVCPVNSPANAATLAMSAAVSGGSGHGEDAPEAQVGSRRHYFVRVSAK